MESDEWYAIAGVIGLTFIKAIINQSPKPSTSSVGRTKFDFQP
jgi:hypothetical protein